MSSRHVLSFLSTLVLLAACQRSPQLDTRTFNLEHIEQYRAAALVEPYVYGAREGSPGAISVIDGAISVRETPDNLDKIARVLAEYDQPRPDVQLHFQLIEADGFTDSDERIAAVETELRQIFRFAGYRLAGEAFVTATDASEVQLGLVGSGNRYQINARTHWARGNMIRLEVEVTLHEAQQGPRLQTTVNIRPGQTLVLGSSPKLGDTATLLLTVHAEEVDAVVGR